MTERLKAYISSESRNSRLYKNKFNRLFDIIHYSIKDADLLIVPIEIKISEKQVADAQFASKHDIEVVYIPSDIVLDDKLNLISFFVGRGEE